MNTVKTGVYEGEGQVPILVLDAGDQSPEFYGPWVKWQILGSAGVTTTLRWSFLELLAQGRYEWKREVP